MRRLQPVRVDLPGAGLHHACRRCSPGEVDKRTGQVVSGEYANWTTHPNNPARAHESLVDAACGLRPVVEVAEMSVQFPPANRR